MWGAARVGSLPRPSLPSCGVPNGWKSWEACEAGEKQDAGLALRGEDEFPHTALGFIRLQISGYPLRTTENSYGSSGP